MDSTLKSPERNTVAAAATGRLLLHFVLHFAPTGEREPPGKILAATCPLASTISHQHHSYGTSCWPCFPVRRSPYGHRTLRNDR